MVVLSVDGRDDMKAVWKVVPLAAELVEWMVVYLADSLVEL